MPFTEDSLHYKIVSAENINKNLTKVLWASQRKSIAKGQE